MPRSIVDDERPITDLVLIGPIAAHYKVGVGLVTKIIAYEERGEMAMVPWLAVYYGDWLADRIPACAAIISYGKES